MASIKQSHKTVAIIAIALLAVVGAAAIMYATTRGPGVGGDATIYLTSAQNFHDGRGLGLIEPDGTFRPIPYTPPLYPLILSLFAWPGVSLLMVARLLDAILFAGTICVVGYAFLRFTRSVGLSILAAFLMLVSPVLVRVFSWAMSEPLFLFTGFLGLFLAVEFTENSQRKLLVGAALASGASFLARYIGVGFVGAAGLVVLLLSRQRWARRVIDTAIFGAISLAPMLVWIVWDFLLTSTVGSRSLEPGSSLFQRLASAFTSLRDVAMNWLIPDSWIDTPPYPHILNNLVLLGAILALAVLVVVVVWRMRRAPHLGSWLDDREVRLTLALALLIAVYLVVTLGVYVTTYPPITLDNRMLVPVHIATLLGVLSLAGLLLRVESRRRWLQALVWLALLVVAGNYLWRGPRIVQQTHLDGLGYIADVWQKSPTMQAVRALPGDVPIITNEATAVMFLAGRPAFALPETGSGVKSAAFTAFGVEEKNRAELSFRRSGGALVLFNSVNDQLAAIYGNQAISRLAALTNGLYLDYSGSDGAIYFFQKPY